MKTKYKIRTSKKFKRDLNLLKKKGLSEEKLNIVIDYLANGDVLPAEYKDHPLRPSRTYKNCRELHIEPDWLLVYRYRNNDLILYLIRTGTHSELF